MNGRHVPSSPHLFRLVARALVAAVIALLAGAIWVHAPLQSAADPSRAPNPARSAWFLLWIQELVSHGTAWIEVVLGLAVGFTLLPWLRRARLDRAAWFQPGERLFSMVIVVLALAIVALTIVAAFLRGEQWQLHLPF